MILEYRCSNYRSIGDAVFFSSLATSDKSLPQNTYEFDNKFFLKESIIYGGNGSGKSNFLRSILTLCKLIVTNSSVQPGDKIFIDKHKLLFDQPQSFFIQFEKRGTRYAYGLVLDNNIIISEYLYFFPNGRKALIFDRDGSVFEFGDSFRKELSLVEKQFLKDNKLMISCGANYSKVEPLQDAFTFFNNDIVMYTGDSSWRNYSTDHLENDSQLRNSFVSFMNSLGDKALRDVNSKLEKRTLTQEQLPPFLSDEAKQKIMSQQMEFPNVQMIYDDYSIDLNEESLGVQKLFDLYSPLMDIIKEGKVLLIDEFDTHLHPLLAKHLIRFFENESSKAQLICSSHDINLLDLDLFRRDQIWFVDMTKNERHTELFSLAEVRAVRKNENISKNYLLGKYNGIPVIDEDKKMALLGDDDEPR